MQGIVAVAVLDVAANGMTYVGGVHTYLVLPARFEFEFHQGVLRGAVEHVVVGYGILASVVHWRRVGDVGFVVLEPVFYRSALFFHLATHHGNVSAVVHYVVPVVLQSLLCLHVLGVDHQSAGVAVKPVHHVGAALLVRLGEVVVQHRLDVQRGVACRHRQYADVLLDNHYPLVFIHNLHVAALQGILVAFALAHGHIHARL